MDAKSKANFINSVAAGQIVPCPKCGAANRPDSVSCITCGADLAATKNSTPAFSAVEETDATATGKQAESVSVFAEGLPSWDVVPPQVVVRRH